MWAIKDKKTLEIKLEFPVSDGDMTLKSLSMRRPTVNDHIQAQTADRTDAEAEVELYAALTGVETGAIQALAKSDYDKIMDGYASFLLPVAPALNEVSEETQPSATS